MKIIKEEKKFIQPGDPNYFIKCKKCNCDNIWKKQVEEWDEAHCPICGEDLKTQEDIRFTKKTLAKKGIEFN